MMRSFEISAIFVQCMPALCSAVIRLYFYQARLTLGNRQSLQSYCVEVRSISQMNMRSSIQTDLCMRIPDHCSFETECRNRFRYFPKNSIRHLELDPCRLDGSSASNTSPHTCGTWRRSLRAKG